MHVCTWGFCAREILLLEHIQVIYVSGEKKLASEIFKANDISVVYNLARFVNTQKWNRDATAVEQNQDRMSVILS